MAFSWKANRKNTIKRTKERIKIYLKHGNTKGAQKLKAKVERQERENA